jgi:VPDSG-CTERM motif
MRIPKAKYITAVLLAIASFALQQARADFVSLLNVGNTSDPGISGYPGPYAKMDVHLDSSTMATITFTSLTNNGNIYLMGGAQGTDLNVNGTATASVFNFSQAGQTGFSAPSEVGQGPGTVDGFGDFNLTIDYHDGFKNAFNSVRFTLTATGSTTWSSAANVLAFNDDGYDAAAHIYVTEFPALQSNDAIATGFGAENAAGTVPDAGATAMLLGMALTAVGAVRRFAIS